MKFHKHAGKSPKELSILPDKARVSWFANWAHSVCYRWIKPWTSLSERLWEAWSIHLWKVGQPCPPLGQQGYKFFRRGDFRQYPWLALWPEIPVCHPAIAGTWNRGLSWSRGLMLSSKTLSLNLLFHVALHQRWAVLAALWVCCGTLGTTSSDFSSNFILLQAHWVQYRNRTLIT